MLVNPGRRGNRRVDSLRNILETGRVGLLFLILGMGETLRVNGRAYLIRDDDLLEPLTLHAGWRTEWRTGPRLSRRSAGGRAGH